MIALQLLVLVELFCLVCCNNEADVLITKRKSCIFDEDCFYNQYCLLYMNKGLCMPKGKDGDWCFHDTRCLSNHCHFFRCKGLQVGNNFNQNGYCEDHEDCSFERFCKNFKCSLRKLEGSCNFDEQCLSNHCNKMYKCVIV